MDNSTFDYPLPMNLRNNQANPHDKTGLEKPSELESPAKAQGGLLMTPIDLAKLTVEILNAYNGNSKILTKEIAIKLIHKELELPFKLYNQKVYMGLGAIIFGDNINLAFLHNDYNSPSSVCIVIGFPNTGQGAVIAVNSENGEQLYLEVIATLVKEFNWPNGQFYKE